MSVIITLKIKCSECKNDFNTINKDAPRVCSNCLPNYRKHLKRIIKNKGK